MIVHHCLVSTMHILPVTQSFNFSLYLPIPLMFLLQLTSFSHPVTSTFLYKHRRIPLNNAKNTCSYSYQNTYVAKKLISKFCEKTVFGAAKDKITKRFATSTNQTLERKQSRINFVCKFFQRSFCVHIVHWINVHFLTNFW